MVGGCNEEVARECEAPVRPNRPSLRDGVELRRRHIRIGLYVVLAIQGLSLLQGNAPPGMRVVNLATILFSCLCLWRLARSAQLIHLGRVVSTGFTMALVAASLVHLRNGWPATLSFIPLAVAYATLIGDGRNALANLILSFATVASAYLLFAVPHPPFLAIQVINWGTACLLLLAILWRMAAALGQGSVELSSTTDALNAAGAASSKLSRVLSGQVSKAVDELATALRERPEVAPPLAVALGELLEESRARVPAEPPLGTMTLGDRLDHLRTTVIDASLGLIFLASIAGGIRVALLGPAALAPHSYLQIAIFMALAIVRLLRPRWRSWVMGFGLVCFAVLLPNFVIHWHATASIAPPYTPLILAGAIITSLTLGRAVGGILLVEYTVVSLMALHSHPGIRWTIPVNLALATAGLSWVITKWPRDLLTLLHARRGEALARIREQRRLISTLLHDLANPLQAIMVWVHVAESGEDTPEDLQWARDMVSRMQGLLAALVPHVHERTALAARPLCEALISMFREQLASKKLRLAVEGQAGITVMANESLLRDSVLANLLSNAIKFSPSGGDINMRIEQDGQRAILRIEDRGSGLPDDVVAAFVQGQRAPSHRGTAGETGSGYGLLLAREHIEGMGGTMDFSAREGGGLRVQITLPLAEGS